MFHKKGFEMNSFFIKKLYLKLELTILIKKDYATITEKFINNKTMIF